MKSFLDTLPIAVFFCAALAVGGAIFYVLLDGVNGPLPRFQISTAQGIYTGIWVTQDGAAIRWQDPVTKARHYASAPYSAVEIINPEPTK